MLRRGGLAGEVVERDDDDGPGNNSLIDRVLTAGRYIIEATTFYADGVEADFTLSVRAVPRVLYDGPVADVARPGLRSPRAHADGQAAAHAAHGHTGDHC